MSIDQSCDAAQGMGVAPASQSPGHQPSASAASADATASSQSGVPNADEWEAGTYIATTQHGKQTAVGWVRGLFALDYRPRFGALWESDLPLELQGAWLITHRPTGYGVLGLSGTLDEAKALVDELAALGDWNFKRPSTAKKRFEVQVRSIQRRFGERITSSVCTIPQWHDFASGIEAATADETRSGSAEGESPTAESRDAQTPSGSPS